MRKYFFKITSFQATLLLVLVTILSSCTKEEETLVLPTPSNFAVEISNVLAFSADLEWTAATISDNSKITYDVYLNGVKIEENLSGTVLKLNGLSSNTSYSGKITAKSSNGKTRQRNFSFATTDDPSPGSFKITIADIAINSAIINWTASVLPDNGTIAYDLLLDGEIIAENLEVNTFALSDLLGFKKYTVKVVAKSIANKTNTQQEDFTTLGTPPSSFPLSVTETQPNWVVIDWVAPTVEDGSSFHYAVYLNDERIFDFLTPTAHGWTFQDLNEGEEYTIKIVASSSNGTATEETINYTTIVWPRPSDFSISAEHITSASIVVNWTASTMTDGTSVVYYLYLDGVQVHPEFTYIGGTTYTIENLDSNRAYVIKVVAEEAKYHKTIEKEINFTTYPVHPSITVDKATLYTKFSTYFAEQLNVKFNQSIWDVNIIKFHAGKTLDIPSFIFYTSAISSPTLSVPDYFTVLSFKYGYVLIQDSGTTYIVDFTVVEETN